MNATLERSAQLGHFAAFQTLLSGERGTSQTIELARKLVDRAVKDPYVNRTAIDLVRNTPQYDDCAKIEAIYNWVAQNFTYIQDPVGPFGAKETLRPVRDLLALRAGDCDDINLVLFPALLGTLGYTTRAVTIAADSSSPREFSHVYCEVEFDGDWIPLDAARPGSRFGEAPPFYFRKKLWPMTDVESSFKLMGRGLAGYVGGMKRTAMGDVAQDISAAGSAAAQVINAANQNPFSYQYYSNANVYNPYGLATSAAPGLTAPALGYPYSVSGSLGASTPLLIGGALLLLLLMRNK